jgi:hypothetical protein
MPSPIDQIGEYRNLTIVGGSITPMAKKLILPHLTMTMDPTPRVGIPLRR